MKTVINFVKGSIEEMRTKVTWPTLKELQGSATLVVISSLIFAMLIWGMDYLFKNGVSAIYKYF